MASGIWTSVSGASAQAHNVDVIANNLANSDTPGFKKDMPTFREYMAVVERDQTQAGIPRIPLKDRDFHPLDGRDQSHVVVSGTHINFTPGNLRVTHAPLDVALDGKGFFEVSTPSGVRYTKHGSFKLAMDGRLVTSEGYPVLASQPGGLASALPTVVAVQPSQGGQETQGGVTAGPGNEAARYINLRDAGGALNITEQGEIYSGDQLLGRLSVVEFQDMGKLRKTGAQMFENSDEENVIAAAPQTRARQGMIETSNVNPIEEMTNLIKANRMYEADMKALKTYGEMLSREAVDIGKF